MKYAKTFRLLGIAIVLALLLIVAIPAAPALAVRGISLNIDEGKVGDEISISGTDFNQSTEETDRYATIYFSSQEANTTDAIDNEVTIYEKVRSAVWLDENGDFGSDYTSTTVIFDVPLILNDGAANEDVTAGTYYVYICHYLYPQIRAVATFTVVGGEIAIDPDEGPVGTDVEIIGSEFAGSQDIIIEFDGREIDVNDIEGDIETESDGDFESFILIPESTAGTKTITITVSGGEVTADFTVEPDITLDKTSGEAGATVTVSGTGFGRRSDVVIYFNNIGVATRTTSSKGSFDTTFTVPADLSANIYTIEVEDGDDNLDTVGFTVIVPSQPEPPPTPPTPPTPPPPPPPSTSGSLSPTTTGNIGTDLIVSGTGFEAGAKVTVKYDDEEVSTATTTDQGILIAAFKVPISKSGDHTVSASDGTNTLELTFTVESTVPEAPPPLLPEMGVTVKSPITFDWKDITDDSPPVTYTLQIATDDDFDAKNIVLEKKGLAESEYILTELEELELGGLQTPYYWRVNATDAASNEGEWTGAGEFYASTPFALPSWAIYTMIGVGGLLLFAIGYWLGRRTAFYY